MLRAATFSAVWLGLGVGVHRMMSGAAIPPWALLSAGVGVFAASRIGAGRERGLPGVTALVGVLQVGLYLLCDFAQRVSDTTGSGVKTHLTPGACPPLAAGTRAAGITAIPPLHLSLAGVPAAHMSGAGMILAHVLAAVLSACWLHRAEAAVHAIARSAEAWVLGFIIAAPVRVPRLLVRNRRRPRFESAPRRPRSQWLGSSSLLRGPPRIVSFA
jgi:hypothetical protein